MAIFRGCHQGAIFLDRDNRPLRSFLSAPSLESRGAKTDLPGIQVGQLSLANAHIRPHCSSNAVNPFT